MTMCVVVCVMLCVLILDCVLFFFFFQAEDGIRDLTVTGVQTCALPICGVEGMVEAIRFARESGLPFFGICLGMQTAIIEFARNVCGLEDSHSSEFAPECDNAVISLMESQQHVTDVGGTMRLGAYPCRLARGSRAAEIYGVAEVSERHRHRYEVSNRYRDLFVQNGMRLSGLSPDGQLVEIIELGKHPWFIGCQFHPELQSRPTRPHPLFAGFIAAAERFKRGK